uniref:WW domain containing adaptor with coiled-coil n=1 Tax=Amphilophus citrinellus TaxID=61819 RepID=A0A3Q0RIA4_AMPCI
VRDGPSDPVPPYKIQRRSDESPVSRHGDGKAKTSHTVRGKNGNNKQLDPADDWTEHISSSGKKYYYNCRTEVSQWEKPKDLLEREQRQKDPVKLAANSFPRDMDYRQEALQDKATSSAPSSMSSSSSSSSGQVSSSAQLPSPTLLQDPALLHQLLPALQATLQMNNGSMDMAKLNEAAVTQASLQSVLHKLLTAGPAFNVTALLSAAQHSNQAQHSSQSPVSLTSDTSSPRPYVSPRNGTPQSNQKSHLAVHPGSITSSQTRVSFRTKKVTKESCVMTALIWQHVFREASSQDMCTGSNISGASLPHGPSSSTSQLDTPGSFTPSLAAHFDENLIRHIQGWPSENTEKQAARLREDIHNMGSLYMSEICTEMKNLRSLVRVCEIQATLREQRILFLRQQSKELDKLKNQNSYMV